MQKKNKAKTTAVARQEKPVSTKEITPDREAVINAARFIKRLQAYQSPMELKKIQRYFKTEDDQYGAGDEFMGVHMGHVLALAKEFIEMPPAEI